MNSVTPDIERDSCVPAALAIASVITKRCSDIGYVEPIKRFVFLATAIHVSSEANYC